MKRRRRKNRALAWFLGTLSFLLVGLMSFAFYNLLNAGVTDFLSRYGIESFYVQNGIILGVCGVILALLGYSVYKIFNKTVGK